MSSVVAGLLFLALGWKLYKDCIVTRYIALKNSGHPQYFGGALCAIQIFVLALSVDLALQECGFMRFVFESVAYGLPVLAKPDEQEVVAPLFRILVWAVPITWALVFLLNHPLHRSPRLLIAAAKKSRIIDELEETIYYSLENQLSLCVSLKSGKVYIGLPKRASPDPDRDRVWLSMIPLASGHRDKQGALHLETFYADVRSARRGRRNGAANGRDDFQVVLPLGEIVTAQSFDLFTYARLRSSRDSSQNKGLVNRLSAGSSLNTQPSVARMNDRIVSPQDRFHLRVYIYYLILINLSVLLLPLSPVYSGVCAVVAVVACFEVIKPATHRLKDFIVGICAPVVAERGFAQQPGRDLGVSPGVLRIDAKKRLGNSAARNAALTAASRRRCS